MQPGGDVGVLDVGDRDDGAGEDDGVDHSAERLGGLADDPLDGLGVLDVEFERAAADGFGQLGQQVESAGRHRDGGSALGGAGGDGMTDSGGRADDEDSQSGGVAKFNTHCPSPSMHTIVSTHFPPNPGV